MTIPILINTWLQPGDCAPNEFPNRFNGLEVKPLKRLVCS